MKHIMQGITLAVFSVVLLITVMSVIGRDKRESEAAAALSYAIKDTVKNMSVTGAYRIYDEEQFKADFIELLINNIRTYDSDRGYNDNNMAIQIDFAEADKDNELLVVHIKERFSYPIGRDGLVEDSAVVEFVDEAVQKAYMVSYVVPYEEALKYECCSDYKEYYLEEDQLIKVPLPYDDEADSLCWRCIESDNEGSIPVGAIYSDVELRMKPVDGNYRFRAVI